MINHFKPYLKKTNNTKYLICFYFILAYFISFGQHEDNLNDLSLNSIKDTIQVSTREWYKYNDKEFGLSLKSPYELEISALKLPGNVKELIDKISSSKYILEDKFQISVNSILYNSSIGEISLQGAANGSISEMIKQKGVSDFMFSEDYIYKNNIPGFIQNISFYLKGEESEFINIVYVNKLTINQITIGYKKNDEYSKAIAKKIIDSIELKKSNNAL